MLRTSAPLIGALYGIVKMRAALFILTLATVVAGDAAAGELSLEQAILQALARGDAPAAASLFHYPPGRTSAANEDDKRGVRSLLEAIVGAMGAVTNATPGGEREPSLGVTVGAGDLDYWEAHPQFRRQTYIVKFAKFGAGLLNVDVAEIDGKPALRGLVFALPSARPDAQNKMQELGRILGETVEKLTNGRNRNSI